MRGSKKQQAAPASEAEIANAIRWKKALEAATYKAKPLQPLDGGEQESTAAATEEQALVLDLVLRQRKSIFFYGPAGAGKTWTLNMLIKGLKDENGVFVTASTGIAATHIGGTTLHSFAGAGIDMSRPQEVVLKVDRNKGARDRWRQCRVLIIDEVSMLDGEFFSTLNLVAQAMRSNAKPFGGIQLVLSGDYLQLPPVAKSSKDRKYLFETNVWKECIQQVVKLQRVFRQREDTLKDLFQSVRLGKITDAQDSMLKKRVKHPLPDNGIRPTRLYTTRVNVETENEKHLAKLEGKVHAFKSTLEVKAADRAIGDTMVKNCLAPTELRLKVGAQVMLLKNADPPFLVNGSRGRVTGFSEQTGLPLVEFESGVTLTVPCDIWQACRNTKNVVATYTQIPLCLAWAMTIHKCQGMTLDKVELDIGQCWEPGQAYVALSRCTMLNGLSLLSYNRFKIKADLKVLEYYASLGDKEAYNALLEQASQRARAVNIAVESATESIVEQESQTKKAKTQKDQSRHHADSSDYFKNWVSQWLYKK